MKRSVVIIFFLRESLSYALTSLITNRLRAFLSILGITIGIFSIISVYTVIDALELSVRQSIQTLGDNVVYIQKWPWSVENNYPWWKYLRRPVPRIEEMDEISRRSDLAQAVAFQIFTSKTIQYRDNYAENIEIVATTHDYQEIRAFEMAEGRFFSPSESAFGRNRAIMGWELASQLFGDESPVGKTIKISGHKLLIIGVFQKEGSDLFGMSNDSRLLIPLQFARTLVNIRDESLGPMILVKARKGVPVDELIGELEGIMRGIRHLKPSVESDFALNKSSIITQGFDQLFAVIDVAGTFIGIFAIVVGAFGIANIMFVAVREQTRVIGIQKAIGARSRFILVEFLFEAVILSVIGGFAGLLLIFIGTLIANSQLEMTFLLTPENLMRGLVISVVVGLVSGYFPARKASRMNPVVAMSTV